LMRKLWSFTHASTMSQVVLMLNMNGVWKIRNTLTNMPKDLSIVIRNCE
jgi:hypothetical protein